MSKHLSGGSWGFNLFLILFSLVLAACDDKSQLGAAVAAPTVQVTPVARRNIPQYVEYVGQTEAPVSVEIRARVEGFVQEVAFVEGSNVKEGDLLFVIDPKPYEEKLARAKGKLAETQAGYLRAKSDVERFRPLAKMQAIPQRDFDDAVALEKAAQAQVDAAQADVRSAELDLGYTKISAPVSGRIGSTSARVGSLVGKGEPTLLATISNTDRMWVSFGISEVEYLNFQKRRQERPREAQDFKIELLLADGSVHPHPGKVNFADRSIDPKTGTLRVRVEFPNPEGVLRPGQFGRVRVLLGEQTDALVVPISAVQEVQGTYSVFVVGADQKASFRPVKPGLKFDNLWIIEEGLQVGEEVIVEGVQKVKDGMTVVAQEQPLISK
ncbi:MAG: efflux RND transporter periplasmic adaptor subunit [Deltaproteobacteria bacterium]|nr:efflux RND transporter periplasmic adaptor subunit [Deltaproteobacteria bacterium]